MIFDRRSRSWEFQIDLGRYQLDVRAEDFRRQVEGGIVTGYGQVAVGHFDWRRNAAQRGRLRGMGSGLDVKPGAAIHDFTKIAVMLA